MSFKIEIIPHGKGLQLGYADSIILELKTAIFEVLISQGIINVNFSLTAFMTLVDSLVRDRGYDGL